MNPTYTAKSTAAALLVALLAWAASGTAALAQEQEGSLLQAACTDESGALFRVDNFDEHEYDFTLKEMGEGGMMISGSAYPIGRGGAYAYLPAGASAELVVRGEVVATAEADPSACMASTVDAGRPICEGIGIDPETREALFVGGADFRGVSEIEITVENGKVLVYDPHALFVVEAGGAPAPVFEVERRDGHLRRRHALQRRLRPAPEGEPEREGRLLRHDPLAGRHGRVRPAVRRRFGG